VSAKRQRERRRRERTLAIVPTPSASASPKVRLALAMRNEANLTGPCACGAVRKSYEVLGNGRMVPVDEPTSEPGHVYYARFEHEHDCPAVSPDLERAFAAGELRDPAGDLLKSLLADRSEEA